MESSIYGNAQNVAGNVIGTQSDAAIGRAAQESNARAIAKEQGMAEMMNQLRLEEAARRAEIARMGYREPEGGVDYISPEMLDTLRYQEANIPAGYVQGPSMIQGAPVGKPAPDLMYTNETAMPAPDQGLGSQLMRR